MKYILIVGTRKQETKFYKKNRIKQVISTNLNISILYNYIRQLISKRFNKPYSCKKVQQSS